MNRKELSEVVAEAAVRTERAAVRTEMARADIEVSRAGIEAARRRQEEAVARHEAAVARQDKILDEVRAMGERSEKMLQGYIRRADEIIAEDRQWAKRIFAELDDQRDERRALMEALLQLIDRLPPPPPHLRSA